MFIEGLLIQNMSQRARALIGFLALMSVPICAQTSRESLAKSTAINGPTALALDHDGHLFVVEEQEYRVRRIDLVKGTIKTVAGKGQKDCCYRAGVPATGVALSYVAALAVDHRGDLLIAEWERVLRVDSHTGLISTVAGTGKSGNTAEGSPALSVSFGQINGLAVDSVGNLFIADGGQHKIFKVSATGGIVSRVAGSGKAGFSGDGGPALEASFLFPLSIALDPTGNIFVADRENCRIRRIDYKTGIVDTIAQTGGPDQNCPPQPGNIGAQPSPSDPVVDSEGNVYFVQESEDVVARVGPNREKQSIVAGTGDRGFRGDGGPATAAKLANPAGLAVDLEGNIFISEYVNNRIRRVDAKTKIITTIAGNGLPHRIDVEM
jgi:sugar lactone lactonase YvrE